MGFRFRIEDVVHVNKDPGGHHRTWTVLVGTLETGSMACGGPIRVPCVDGVTVAHIVGFHRFRDPRVNGARVVAEEIGPAPIGVCVDRPAMPKEVVLVGSLATDDEAA